MDFWWKFVIFRAAHTISILICVSSKSGKCQNDNWIEIHSHLHRSWVQSWNCAWNVYNDFICCIFIGRENKKKKTPNAKAVFIGVSVYGIMADIHTKTSFRINQSKLDFIIWNRINSIKILPFQYFLST